MASDLTKILELASLAAAHAHGDEHCVQKHAQALLACGESERKLSEIGDWRNSPAFDEREKAALSLTEYITLDHPSAESTNPIAETCRFFNQEETIQISLTVLAINDWIRAQPPTTNRVLVVEDNANDQELLRRQLVRAGLNENVLFLQDAEQAMVVLEQYEDKACDREVIAILLDLNLPGMSGVDFLRRVRAMARVKKTPVLVMTSSNRPQDLEQCQKLKVAGYIQKPVTFSSFSKAIADIFHSAGNGNAPMRALVE